MKRTVQMAQAGVPSAKPGCAGLITPNRYGWFLKARRPKPFKVEQIEKLRHQVDYGATANLETPVLPKLPWYHRFTRLFSQLQTKLKHNG